MKKIWKIITSALCLLLVVTATSCNKGDNNDNSTAEECSMTLEDLNKMLNDKVVMDMNKANHIEIIPFNHVNGPKEEWKFYALVNFEYDMETYVKYQVTYLSCTCRSPNVNYWQTAYMELTKPESGVANDVVLQTLSFDKDIQDEDLPEGSHNYIAGFWGDSSPIYSGNNIIATYDKVSNGEGGYYPSIKYDFIPKLVGKTKAQIDPWVYYTDMNDADLNVFSGASVSTNNIIRIVQATMAYHADRYL